MYVSGAPWGVTIRGRYMRAIQVLAMLFLSFALLGCDGTASTDVPRSVAVGTIVTLKAFGNHYELEAIRAEGLTTAWQLRWEDRDISIQKDYRGIMTLGVTDLKESFSNEFDPAEVDALFPLEVGKETSFSGIKHDPALGEESPFWTHITVRKKTEIKIKNGTYPVFVLDITIDGKWSGEKKRSIRTIWYSPDLGMRLKAKFKSETEYFEVRVLSIDPPSSKAAPASTRGRGFGAVII